MQFLPFFLGLRTVCLGVDRLVLVVRFDRLTLFILIFIDHAEDTQQRVAYGTESLGLFLMTLANLKLYLLNGRRVPVRIRVDNLQGFLDLLVLGCSFIGGIHLLLISDALLIYYWY
jgi:hypothetical protein